MEPIITKNNVVDTFEHLVVGLIRAENYNSKCYGMLELGRAHAMNQTVDIFISRTVDAGYCQHAILGPTLQKYGYKVRLPEDMALKKEVDEQFQIDMSDYEQEMEYSSLVFDSTVEAINEGLMKYR